MQTVSIFLKRENKGSKESCKGDCQMKNGKEDVSKGNWKCKLFQYFSKEKTKGQKKAAKETV